ncbi:hypothetical protein BKP35_10405 [Anaerobacillus arseniciselenatis]|uniref:HTH cro/C1-type domain-containing protein n=1 Tax=Anaerobacillus arseniciselenatis TaxID=85682 RepID=A0A1S2LKC0_9BACI|nr:helix-turn-helix transcriptional regulator [Anaerobacillus arseniciselenatis]OIJ12962.1 hypothetical protein BKP35_10405 [Anaerobacillus arseniciselenatis]
MDLQLMKHVRQIAELTQEELAEKVGVHRTLINKIETGAVPVQDATLQKIKRAFNDAGITDADIELLASVFASKNMKSVRKDWGAGR